MARDSAVREAAYLLWEQDGKPEGRELDYWLAAEAILGNGTSKEGGKAAARPRRATSIAPKATSRARTKVKESPKKQTP